jgi:hypothetical protein
MKERKDVFLIARITKGDKLIVEEIAKERKVSISQVVREMIKFFTEGN